MTWTRGATEYDVWDEDGAPIVLASASGRPVSTELTIRSAEARSIPRSTFAGNEAIHLTPAIESSSWGVRRADLSKRGEGITWTGST